MANNALMSIAKSKATANRLAKTLTTAELKKAITNLQSALNSAKKREADKATKKQAANLKKLKAMMAEMGLSAADLRKVAGQRTARKTATKKAAAKSKRGPKKGKKVAAKYQLKMGKETHKWTGRGRMPLVFKAFLDKNGSLDKCLIK
jgi:DNA-binding protein H-NS